MAMLFNVLLIQIVVTAAVSANPRYVIKSPQVAKQAKTPSCLPLGKPCLTSGLSCCTLIYQNTYMGFGSVPTTCFKFGKGVCQVNQSIKNFDVYNRLVLQLNATNFQELKSKYWSSIPTVYACPQKVTIEVKGV